MKINRRKFLRSTGLAGAGIAGTGLMFGKARADAVDPNHIPYPQTFNMHDFAAPKMEKVRIGFIGTGSRGSGTVMRMASIENVELKALCDLHQSRIDVALKLIRDEFPGRYNPDTYAGREDGWKEVCERKDIDLIYIATPWALHGPIALYAMENKKHLYTELPVGVTLEQCWKVVETSERTRQHCFIGCGSCHDGLEAVDLNMVRQGYFGEIIHGEGHYVHDRVSDPQRWIRDEKNYNWFGYRPWRLKENVNRNGNLYPQHGLGPVAQMMDLNYGDQMEYLASISSNDFTMGNKMKEIASSGDEYFNAYDGLNFRGNINTTIIRTRKGRTLMLQHDISSPRPGLRFNIISGTQGIFSAGGHARSPAISISDAGWIPQEEFDSLVEKYTPEISRKFKEIKKRAGGARGTRGYEKVTASDWRLIDCLRNGLPLEMDVYETALWSSVTPLSEWSVAHHGASAKVPDFTNGAWKDNNRGMDIDIPQGGTTELI